MQTFILRQNLFLLYPHFKHKLLQFRAFTFLKISYQIPTKPPTKYDFIKINFPLIINSIALFSVLSTGIDIKEIQAAEGSYNWSESQSLVTPVQEIYPAVYEQEIYVSGGFVPSESPVFFGLSPTKQTFIFNPEAKKWSPGPQLPEQRHHLGLVSNSTHLYGVGGFSGEPGNAWEIKNTVYRLDKAANKWVDAPKLPIPLAESVYASVGDNIHVIGGKTRSIKTARNIDTTKHYILKNNKQWVEAAELSIARNSAASAVLNNKIYVIGGR
ncbi:MAG: hypothetical protein KUG78_19870, partial [Kangiellaceae bacterium]|nr:hypothetical protein [Kangiellaceae bacterium]